MLKNNLEKGFSLSPNPAKSNLIINHPVGTEHSFIQIIQVDGKVLHKQIITVGAVQSSLNISALKSGMYLVTVYSGIQTTSFKFIKE